MNEERQQQIRLLMVDENEADAEKIFTQLRDAGIRLAAERVQSEEGLADALRELKPHVVLSEHTLPLLDYRTTLKVVQSIRPGTPVIVMSGPLRGDDTGSCVRAGA